MAYIYACITQRLDALLGGLGQLLLGLGLLAYNLCIHNADTGILTNHCCNRRYCLLGDCELRTTLGAENFCLILFAHKLFVVCGIISRLNPLFENYEVLILLTLPEPFAHQSLIPLHSEQHLAEDV